MEDMVIARAVVPDDRECIRFVESYPARKHLAGVLRSITSLPSKPTRQVKEIGILAVFIEDALCAVLDLRGSQHRNRAFG